MKWSAIVQDPQTDPKSAYLHLETALKLRSAGKLGKHSHSDVVEEFRAPEVCLLLHPRENSRLIFRELSLIIRRP
jgi:hypothetical protein